MGLQLTLVQIGYSILQDTTEGWHIKPVQWASANCADNHKSGFSWFLNTSASQFQQHWVGSNLPNLAETVRSWAQGSNAVEAESPPKCFTDWKKRWHPCSPVTHYLWHLPKRAVTKQNDTVPALVCWSELSNRMWNDMTGTHCSSSEGEWPKDQPLPSSGLKAEAQPEHKKHGMASLVGLILMLLSSCVVSPWSHTLILIPCCTDCRMKGLIKCPALHFQLRAAHAHRRWQNERHDHSTSSHEQFWAQVLDLFETLEDEEYSTTKKGHSILKTVKTQGENSDFTYQGQAEKPEMHWFAQGSALAEVNGSSHACEGTNVCQLWV